jgi:acyl-CoA dehydrogenase
MESLMDFEFSPKVQELRKRLLAFMDEFIYPNEALFREQVDAGDRWAEPAILEELKPRAQEAGLWNLFLPQSYGDLSPGLTVLEYAPLAEIMGRVLWASEVFNCSAPDTGNMEVLARYGSKAQQEQWLQPLMRGEIRSAFCMTEPDVASSDATNIQTSMVLEGDEYVINGRKWWSSGACGNRCKIYIVMGKTDPDHASRYHQQSMILVPADTDGVSVERPLRVFGYDDAPEGHAEVVFDKVRVPASNMLLGEGRGFEIAQGRLGPGRIHHCMSHPPLHAPDRPGTESTRSHERACREPHRIWSPVVETAVGARGHRARSWHRPWHARCSTGPSRFTAGRVCVRTSSWPTPTLQHELSVLPTDRTRCT